MHTCTCTVMWMWSCLPDHLRMQSGWNCDWRSARVFQVQMQSAQLCSRLRKVVLTGLKHNDTHVTFHTALVKKCHVTSSHLHCYFLSFIVKRSPYRCKGWFTCCGIWCIITASKDDVFISFQLTSKYRLHLPYVFIDCATFPPAPLLYKVHMKNGIAS